MDTAGAALRPRLRLDVRAAYRAGGQGLRLRLPEDRIRPAGRRAGHQLRMGAMPGSLSEKRSIAANPKAAGLAPGAASRDRIAWVRAALVVVDRKSTRLNSSH